MPGPDQALPGRDIPMPVINRHYVNGHPIQPPFPEGLEQAVFGLGCFWGERKFYGQVAPVMVVVAPAPL
jgi:peptide-methionine (S)-S-oxide reductase